MQATFTNGHHSALDESPNAFDYVTIGHRHSNDWDASSRWRRGEKGALAFEDPDQPEEITIVDGVIYADS